MKLSKLKALVAVMQPALVAAQPYSNSTRVPYSNSTAVPYSNSTTVPYSGSTTVPYSNSTTVPYSGSTTVPYSNSTTVPYSGSTTVPYSDSTRVCTSYTIPITTTSLNWIWGAPFFNDNFDLTDFVNNVEARVTSPDFHIVTGREIQTASYSIAGTFCTPKTPSAKSKTVLLASHGLDFDGTYWDLQIPGKPQYNFVDHAISKGYSVFFYDRLGVGKSAVISGYLNQIVIQAEILKSLAASVKSGVYTGTVGKPEKFVLIGHSFGSALSATVTAADPAIADAIILTGYSFNSTGGNALGFFESAQLRIASGAAPQFKQYDTGYVTPVDIYSNTYTFLKKPDYELSVNEYSFAHRSPIGVFEPLSLGLPDLDVAPVNFTGSALLLSGQFDYIFCTGQCDDVLEEPAKEIFSNAKNFKSVSYPGSGHGLNLASNVTGAYNIITDFLASSGL